jgi:hypothetical protein
MKNLTEQLAEDLEIGILIRWKQTPGRHMLAVLKHFGFIGKFVECSEALC